MADDDGESVWAAVRRRLPDGSTGLLTFVAVGVVAYFMFRPPEALAKLGFASSVVGGIATAVFAIYSLGLLLLFGWAITRVRNSEGSDTVPVPLLSDDNGKLSLSRVQMFLWTITMLFAWLLQLVLNPLQFPELPDQALLMMGISGATYLGGKRLDATKNKPAPESEPKPPPRGAGA